ncbi:hypothetical protein Pph01_31900 [Planotetraspora phitsanulokensis]|uniref:Uncharacterized protein n=1 Tax=Planotetraspora phitsanulokensis TaxID=575192 RepID=A0A8J3U6Z8_9ACTN|nr:hypothetical protein Pph01_31900 [Planotetraspora phitsanulokensis]
MEGAFHGLQGKSVGGGRRDVLAGGRMKAREEQKPEKQNNHFNEHGGAPTHASDKRARSGMLDQARKSTGGNFAPRVSVIR